MEWRCEWCGKPHEENDPPCDNCGHGKFEKAVVRQGSAGDANSTVVWVCTDCGREHTRHSPPCSRCNNATLERREKTVSDEELTKRPGAGSGDERVARETTTVWTCSQCGREHARHTATCNNCGNADLEETEKRISESETTVPGYLDLVTPQYALALGAVLLIAVVAVLGFAGVIDVPFISNGVPEVENVPGSAEETESGIELAEVESAYVDAINEQREAERAGALTRTDRLDEIARFDNQQRVKAQVTDEGEIDEQRVEELLREECQQAWAVRDTAPIEDGDTAGSLAEKFVAGGFSTLAENEKIDTIGVDAHAVDGRLFLVSFRCVSG
jgi:ribosomal protein L37AE/L43A